MNTDEYRPLTIEFRKGVRSSQDYLFMPKMLKIVDGCLRLKMGVISVISFLHDSMALWILQLAFAVKLTNKGIIQVGSHPLGRLCFLFNF